jgi:hypothetical protein
MSAQTYFHGTSESMLDQIRQNGLVAVSDAYARGAAAWVTPDRYHAIQYAFVRVLKELVAVDKAVLAAIARLPSVLIAELRLDPARSSSAGSKGTSSTWSGGCAADKVVKSVWRHLVSG